jgi:hypothetical protein
VGHDGPARRRRRRDEPELVDAWQLVDNLLGYVGTALDTAHDRSQVTDGPARPRQHGTGAQRQRRAGLHDPAAAVDAATVRDSRN